jgi:hypothetical protein
MSKRSISKMWTQTRKGAHKDAVSYHRALRGGRWSDNLDHIRLFAQRLTVGNVRREAGRGRSESCSTWSGAAEPCSRRSSSSKTSSWCSTTALQGRSMHRRWSIDTSTTRRSPADVLLLLLQFVVVLSFECCAQFRYTRYLCVEQFVGSRHDTDWLGSYLSARHFIEVVKTRCSPMTEDNHHP